jgi:hypothetical protein
MCRSSTCMTHMCNIFHQFSHIHYKVFISGVFVCRGVHFKKQGPLGNSQAVGRDSCVLSPAHVQGQKALIFSSQYRGLRSPRTAWLSVRDKWVRVVELCVPEFESTRRSLPCVGPPPSHAAPSWLVSRYLSRLAFEKHAFRTSGRLLVVLIISWFSLGYPRKFRNR